jgi:hypothetical protein
MLEKKDNIRLKGEAQEIPIGRGSCMRATSGMTLFLFHVHDTQRELQPVYSKHLWIIDACISSTSKGNNQDLRDCMDAHPLDRLAISPHYHH